MTPNQKIEALARKHQKWLTYCNQYLNEANSMYAEDVVQSAYLQLLQLFHKDNDKEVNDSYFYLMLRSIMFNDSKHSIQTDVLTYSFQVNENITPDEVEKNKPDYVEMKPQIDKVVNTFYEFDKLLFNAYRYEFKSIRQLSKDTKLGHTTVFETVKRCKQKINRKLKHKYYE